LENIVALFAGAGGLSSGFAAAGLKPQVAVELDADACATYERNLGVAPLRMDVADKATIKAIIDSLRSREVSAVIGGPPCQGFSTAGGRWADDPRNRLIFSYFAIVEALQPRWFLFENVEGLLTSGGGGAIVNLVRSFIERGYSVRLQKVNFAVFGLPQTRKRVIIVGNRLGADFELPAATHSFNSGKHKSKGLLPSSPSLMEALAGLGEATRDATMRTPYSSLAPVNAYDALMRDGMSDVSMHYWSASKADEERFRHLRPGQTMKDLPEHLWHSSFKRRAFRRVQDGTPTERRGGAPSGLKRLEGQLNGLTVTSATTREFVHPSADRPLTLREGARLQSFPDSYEFAGTAVSKARQIGNAFPPMCAYAFARHLAAIDGQFGSGLSVASRTPHLIDFVLTDASGMSPALRATSEALTALSAEQLSFTIAAD
jgi:DNA (cytosine-5)-methyltransferase 1